LISSSGDGIDDERMERDPAYRRWVTSEVLPSIRKFGFYVAEMDPSMDLPAALEWYAAFLHREAVSKRTSGAG